VVAVLTDSTLKASMPVEAIADAGDKHLQSVIEKVGYRMPGVTQASASQRTRSH
jgi:hypothetical protein